MKEKKLWIVCTVAVKASGRHGHCDFYQLCLGCAVPVLVLLK